MKSRPFYITTSWFPVFYAKLVINFWNIIFRSPETDVHDFCILHIRVILFYQTRNQFFLLCQPRKKICRNGYFPMPFVLWVFGNFLWVTRNFHLIKAPRKNLNSMALWPRKKISWQVFFLSYYIQYCNHFKLRTITVF